MPQTVHISSYRLRQDKLEDYLKKTFQNVTIDITSGDDTYDVELPDELTQSQYDEIDDLRDKRRTPD
ncbi:hypothetical protein F5Y19DRAFT_235548 [Xylariaceae sp. FL1651]|nr:hypothetical protein F5Y19DRAFT_235548 [Xylariaceae sp. FL1651]